MRRHHGWFWILVQLLAALVHANVSIASDGVAVCSIGGNQSSASIVTDGAGGAIIVWLDTRDGRRDIYAQRVAPDGESRWNTNGVGVSQLGWTNGAPSVVTDEAGGAIIAWDNRSSWDSLLVQRLGPSGAAVWTCDVSQPNFDGFDPVVVPNEGGGALMCWYGYSAAPTRNHAEEVHFIGADVLVERISSSGAPLMGPGERISAAEGDQFWPHAFPAGNGRALVTWQDVASDLIDYAQFILADGTAVWGDGLRLSSIELSQSPAQGVWDGGTGGIFVWADRRFNHFGPRDIFAQHLVAAGPQWGVDGIAVCTANGDQQSPAVVTDGSGGAIVAWADPRSGDRMFVQHIYANGTFEWAGDGISLCDSCAVWSGPVMVSDGSGGAIVAWEDGRAGQRDIYAQRVTASGTMAWGPAGLAVCTSPGSQTEPRIVSDGAAGAIIAWTDARKGTDTDIYAQRVDASGIVTMHTATVPGSASGASLSLRVTPNPMRGVANVTWLLPTPGRVDISVCDISGRTVAHPVVDREYPAGPSTLTWDGLDSTGQRPPAGLYLVRMKVADRSMARRVAILK